MFKMIFLLVGLVLGFGLGVYWGVHNPTQASDLAKKEQEWFLKGKMEATKAISERLDQALAKEQPAARAPGSNFLGGSAPSRGESMEAVRQIRDEQKQELQKIQTELQAKK
jgi:hypothetical protein